MMEKYGPLVVGLLFFWIPSQAQTLLNADAAPVMTDRLAAGEAPAHGSVGAPAEILPPPTQVSPPDGSVFVVYRRTTTVVWEAVPGATSYTLEVEYCQPAEGCDGGGELAVFARDLRETSYTFNFVGAQPGRWRVRAEDVHGQEGANTHWWGFLYTI